jgi:hypothetical protein
LPKNPLYASPHVRRGHVAVDDHLDIVERPDSELPIERQEALLGYEAVRCRPDTNEPDLEGEDGQR